MNSKPSGDGPAGSRDESGAQARRSIAPDAVSAPTGHQQEAEIVAATGPVSSDSPVPPLGRLEQVLLESARRGAAPVDRWSPPYCGDVGLAVAADGTWTYQGSPIRRPALVKLFASVLWRDVGGRHYLVTPVEKVDVVVADAPFLAVEMEVLGGGGDRVIVLRTNVDDVVRVGPANPLRFAVEAGTGGIKPYALVRGRLEALATRSVTHELLALIENAAAEGEPEAYGIRSSGAFFPLPAV